MPSREQFDDELAPLEREAAVSVPPSGRRGAWSWSGWAAASALLVGGAAHYALVYRPLEEQRERIEAAQAQRVQAHEAQLSALRTELERTREELERANVEAAALKASRAEAAAASTAAASEETENAQGPKKSASRRSDRRGRRASDNAFSARRPGASSRRKPQTSDSSMPLRGVLSTSNDPLEGL